ncbi:hypothetical protein [Streptomyces sp. NK08204]|uniref:hypothetical protein n=1 Tax=Streptomyces sp. NK08204 TaxID=2873260 RepID=UPI001CED5AF2|nr:hypothetical protein [Streptomyces sp. NK08204]
MKELVLALVAAVFGLAGTVVGARAAKKGALISAEVTLQQSAIKPTSIKPTGCGNSGFRRTKVS